MKSNHMLKVSGLRSPSENVLFCFVNEKNIDYKTQRLMLEIVKDCKF